MDEGEKGGKPPEHKDTPGAPKEGDWIPKVRFDEATSKLEAENRRLGTTIQQEREERIRLEERLNNLESQPAQQPKQKYTRKQLRQAVDAGTITQDDMDDILENQLRQEIQGEIRSTVTTASSEISRDNLVDTEIRRYKELVPNVLVQGSEERNRVEGEFRYLTGVGQDERSKTTELAALRAALGPVEKLRKTSELTPDRRETHQDVGGGGDEPPAPDAGHAVLKKLNNDQKTYYKRQIDKGIYKDWDQVAKEMEYHTPRRAR
jgi:hypothetical protein